VLTLEDMCVTTSYWPLPPPHSANIIHNSLALLTWQGVCLQQLAACATPASLLPLPHAAIAPPYHTCHLLPYLSCFLHAY